MTLTQNHDSGITIIMAGIMSAVGNILTRIIRKPVATMRKPPQALKSAIISGVVNGTMTPASKKRAVKIMN